MYNNSSAFVWKQLHQGVWRCASSGMFMGGNPILLKSFIVSYIRGWQMFQCTTEVVHAVDNSFALPVVSLKIKWSDFHVVMWPPLPDRQMFLDFSDEAHGRVRARVHGGQDCYDNKQPWRRTGGIHTSDHVVLYERKNKQTQEKWGKITRINKRRTMKSSWGMCENNSRWTK